MVRGKVLYEQNELPEAERALLEGLNLLSRGGIAESYGNVRAVLAQVKQAQGDSEAASAAIQRAVQLALGSSIPRLVNLTEAYQARIWLAQGRLDLVDQWAHDYRQLAETEYVRDFEDLTRARVLLASKRPAEAAALLATLLPPAEAAGGGRRVRFHPRRLRADHLRQRLDRSHPGDLRARRCRRPGGGGEGDPRGGCRAARASSIPGKTVLSSITSDCIRTF